MIAKTYITSTFNLSAIQEIQAWCEAELIDPLPPEPVGNILWETSYDGTVYIDVKTAGHELFGTDSNGNVFPDDMVGLGLKISDYPSPVNWFNYVMDLSNPGGVGDPYTDYVVTRIDTGLTIPDTTTTTALYQEFIKDDPSFVSTTRNQYVFEADTSGDIYNQFNQGYIRQKQKIILTSHNSEGWLDMFELKQKSDNYGRFGLYIYGTETTPYFHLDYRYNSGYPGPEAWTTRWQYDSTATVPIDEWFDLEVFWIGSSDSNTGRVQVAVNGVVLFNVQNVTKESGSDSIPYYLMKDKVYGKSAQQWITDVVWAKEPTVGSLLPGSGT